jgi:selenoprotein W-related protein
VSAGGPLVEIVYCRQCRWLLRAAWMAQELLSTFEEELAGVTLRSGTGGIFVVSIDGEIVWSRKDEGRFPDIVELKQRVRDRIAPSRDLGHADRKVPAAGSDEGG